MRGRIIIFLSLFLLCFNGYSKLFTYSNSFETASSEFKLLRQKRPACDEVLKWKSVLTWGGHAAFYVGTYIPLYSVWYKDFPKTSFHFFNDGAEWRSMDKMGHMYTGFKLASFSYRTLDGTYPMNSCSKFKNDRKKTFIASGYSLLYLSTLEIFDGFSSGWGFSTRDMGANLIGIGLFTLQKSLFREIFIHPKFSYHATPYANYRPETLGKTTSERILKDYNGQTYWLSFGLPTEIAELSKFKWINFSIGYNASGMTGGKFNPDVNQQGVAIPQTIRTSSLFFSMDIDWERFRFMRFSNSIYPDGRKKLWLRLLFIAFNTVKLPFPAFEIKQGNKFAFHWFYF